MNKYKTVAWGIIRPDRSVTIDTDFTCENHAWEVVLGWPSQEEINHAKLRGYRAVKLNIEEITDGV